MDKDTDYAGQGWRGKRLASGNIDESVRIWDIAASKELRQLAGGPGEIESIALSPDGKFIASATGLKATTAELSWTSNPG